MNNEKNKKKASKTSWTDHQLFQLSNRANHKIVKTAAGDYIWKHQLDGKWENHCIQGSFSTYKKPASHLAYWTAIWGEELIQRNEKISKEFSSARKRLLRIKDSLNKTTADKINEVKLLGLQFTNEELAMELGISLATVKRALKKDYSAPQRFYRESKKKDSAIYYNMNDSEKVRRASKEYLDYVEFMNSKVIK
tara:strand:- start:177 stop:758 length:582 start_codon:yes stop_codon:yes gene_type:complete